VKRDKRRSLFTPTFNPPPSRGRRMEVHCSRGRRIEMDCSRGGTDICRMSFPLEV